MGSQRAFFSDSDAHHLVNVVDWWDITIVHGFINQLTPLALEFIQRAWDNITMVLIRIIIKNISLIPIDLS